MEIFTSYYTDKGTVKQVNQDSFSVKVVNSPRGKIAFVTVSDGMGGLEMGEVASKEVVVAYNNWFVTQFADMVKTDRFTKEELFEQWQDLADALNTKLETYAGNQGMMMGTTLSALLIYRDRYYVCHIGDSRIYKIDSAIEQITEDQTLVAQEVRLGMLTEDEAQSDPRRSILLQCIGASAIIEPQYETGNIEGEVTFLLCSDGFIHMNTEVELFNTFSPWNIKDKEQGNALCKEMVQHAEELGERDNITVVAVVTR